MEADTFSGIRNHLEILKIANTSLTLLPSFQLPQLKTLNVSSNHLTFVPPNTLANLSDVRDLDLSHNEVSNVVEFIGKGLINKLRPEEKKPGHIQKLAINPILHGLMKKARKIIQTG